MAGKMKYKITDEKGTFQVAEIQDYDLSVKELDEIVDKYGDSKVFVDIGHYIRSRYKHFQCCSILKKSRDENATLVTILEKFANGDNAGGQSCKMDCDNFEITNCDCEKSRNFANNPIYFLVFLQLCWRYF